MKLINLTPHDVDIHSEGEYLLTIPPCGQLCRVEVEYKKADPIDAFGEEVPIQEAMVKKVTGLPQQEKGVAYIVSGRVLSVIGDKRNDLYIPGKFIRDSKDQVIGCEGLVCSKK